MIPWTDGLLAIGLWAVGLAVLTIIFGKEAR